MKRPGTRLFKCVAPTNSRPLLLTPFTLKRATPVPPPRPLSIYKASHPPPSFLPIHTHRRNDNHHNQFTDTLIFLDQEITREQRADDITQPSIEPKAASFQSSINPVRHHVLTSSFQQQVNLSLMSSMIAGTSNNNTAPFFSRSPLTPMMSDVRSETGLTPSPNLAPT